VIGIAGERVQCFRRRVIRANSGPVSRFVMGLLATEQRTWWRRK